jgi:4-amino-4-deoxy-L-arabinose transferase-like glycosyltransferase
VPPDPGGPYNQRVSLRRLEGLPRRPLLIELALLLGLMASCAVAFGRSLRAGPIYDEGVYLASVDALAHGQTLGSQVFASQPPGFYLLLEAGRAIFGGSIVSMRLAMLVVALVGALSAYYIGRCLTGPPGGLLATAALAVPLQVEHEAVRVRGDFPSVALSLLAIALALLAVRQTGVRGPVAASLAGATLALAISVKLLAVPAVVPVVVIVLRSARRLALPLAAGAVTVVAALGGIFADVIAPLWNDSVRFHLAAQSALIHGRPRNLAGNFTLIVDTLTGSNGLRSPFAWLVVVGALATLLSWRRRPPLEAVALWLWAAASLAFVVWHRPLWDHDIVMVTASLAVAAGVGISALLREGRLAARAAVGACALVIAATITHQFQRSPAGQSKGIEWAAAELRHHTSRNSEVASDLPIIPFLADRRQPGVLVDTSTTRIRSGWLTQRTIVRTIGRSRLSAVVIGHNLASEPQVVRAVRARFPFSLSRAGVSLPGERPTVVRIFFPTRVPS